MNYLGSCLKITAILSLVTITGSIIACGVLINKIYNQYDPLINSFLSNQINSIIEDINNITNVVNMVGNKLILDSHNITRLINVVGTNGLNYIAAMTNDLNEIVVRIGAN